MTKKNDDRIAFVTPTSIYSGISIVPSIRGNLEEPYRTHECEQGSKIAKRDNIPIFLSDVLIYNINTGFLEHLPEGNLPVNEILFGYRVSGEYSANSGKAINNRVISGKMKSEAELVIVDIREFRLSGLIKKIDDLMIDKTGISQNLILEKAEILRGFPRHLNPKMGGFTLGKSKFPVTCVSGEKLSKISCPQNYTKFMAPGEDFITFNNEFVTFYRR